MSKAKVNATPTPEKVRAREVLFFELEYVAVNGHHIAFDIFKQLLKSKNINVTPALFARYGLTSRPGKAIQDMLEAEGRTLSTSDPLIAQIEEQLAAAFADKVTLNKHLPALIQAAQKRNIQVAALSAWPEASAKALMTKTGLDLLGVGLAAMDSTDPLFPRADHWLRMLKQFGQDETPLIALVSSRAACKGALMAGATCIALPNIHTEFEDFTGSKIVLNTLGDLPMEELLNLVSRR